MIFLTNGEMYAQSTSIATYNSFAMAQAAPLISMFPSSTWTVVGSTSTVNANVNAPNDKVGGSYLPVYETNGALVSSQSSGGLYAGSILTPVDYDQHGALNVAPVWTGSTATGTVAVGYPLGSTNGLGPSEIGNCLYANSTWLSTGESTNPQYGSFYTLSSILTAPSAAAPVLTASGATGQIWNDHNPLQQPVAVDSGLTLSSSEADLSGASMTIGSGFHPGADSLNYASIDGISGSYNSNTGLLTLSGSATPAAVPGGFGIGYVFHHRRLWHTVD